MIFTQKNVKLNNGWDCMLRTPLVSDAADMLEYLKIIYGETPFMTRYPQEVKDDAQGLKMEEEFLSEVAEKPRDFMIAAFVQGELVGSIGVNPQGAATKFWHRGSVGIALKKKVWGLGLGRILMEEALKQAPKLGYEQVELGVAEGNDRALVLYKKLGFVESGRIHKAFKYKDGSCRDEILMYVEVDIFDGNCYI